MERERRARPQPRNADVARARRSSPAGALPPGVGNRALAAALQRYPITASPTTDAVLETSGRPTTKSNKGTVVQIIARIWANGPFNDYETTLKSLGTQTKAVDAIDKHTWLSQNGAAICHKQAIDEIESYVVAYANLVLAKKNTSKEDTAAATWVKKLTAGYGAIEMACLLELAAIQLAPTKTTQAPKDWAAEHATELIRLLDGSPANLFIGSAQTNSSVQTHLDLHYDVTNTASNAPITASPVSSGIYSGQHDFGPLLGITPQSPDRATDSSGDWVKTSNVPGIGWVVVDPVKKH